MAGAGECRGLQLDHLQGDDRAGDQHASSSGTASNIDIGSGGSVVVTLGSPAVTIDSNNSVKLSTSDALISNNATASAIGIQLNATAAGQGPGAGNFAVDNSGTIDLTGANGSKTGIAVVNKSDAVTQRHLQWRHQAGGGLHAQPDRRRLDRHCCRIGHDAQWRRYDPRLADRPADHHQFHDSGSLTGVYIAGNMNGDFSVGTGATVETTGSGSVGFNLAGKLTGSFVNNGSITVTGTSSAKPAGSNPEAGSAVLIGNSVTGGIYNAGPLSSTSTTARATITAYGTCTGPRYHAGHHHRRRHASHDRSIYRHGAPAAPSYDLVNRGTISAQGIDADINGTAVNIAGTATISRGPAAGHLQWRPDPGLGQDRCQGDRSGLCQGPCDRRQCECRHTGERLRGIRLRPDRCRRQRHQ